MTVQCTCGSKSVGAHLHSTWCDVVATRSRQAFPFLLNSCSNHPYAAFIYLSQGDPKQLFEEFRAYLGNQWSMTGETHGFYTVCLKNGSEVLFTRCPDPANFDPIRGRLADGVLIESCDNVQALVNLCSPAVMTTGGWVKVVDSETKEVR